MSEMSEATPPVVDDTASTSSRQRLSPGQKNPETGRLEPTNLKPHQLALRAAMIESFNAKKARKFLERHIKHISTNRDLADGIKFLFDEKGHPPDNMPLEDVVEERKRIEYQIMWFEGILLELRNRMVRVKELEDYALEMLSRAMPDG